MRIKVFFMDVHSVYTVGFPALARMNKYGRE